MTKTYRGRSLDELLPEIRRELGDDAVILERREAYEGGVGGFFQRRLMEVDAAPARQAAVFRAELDAAFGREEAQPQPQPEAAEPATTPPPAPAHRPHVSEQVADLPEPERTAAIGVDDIFPARPAAEGLASLFAAGAGAPAEPEPAPAPQPQPEP